MNHQPLPRPRRYTLATIQGWRSFRSELPIVWRLFKGDDSLRTASNRRNMHCTGQNSQDHTSSVTLGWLEDGDGHLMHEIQSGGWQWLKAVWDETLHDLESLGYQLSASVEGIWGLVCYKSKGTFHQLWDLQTRPWDFKYSQCSRRLVITTSDNEHMLCLEVIPSSWHAHHMSHRNQLLGPLAMILTPYNTILNC